MIETLKVVMVVLPNGGWVLLVPAGCIGVDSGSPWFWLWESKNIY